MTTITINNKEYFYDESDVISFDEGLIGLPEMRRAVVIAMRGHEPFCWLASLENEGTRFVVVNPHEIFNGYAPFSPEGSKTLAIVKISSEWEKTTVNLRAPIVIDPETRRAAQLILSETHYQFAEKLLQN